MNNIFTHLWSGIELLSKVAGPYNIYGIYASCTEHQGHSFLKRVLQGLQIQVTSQSST